MGERRGTKALELWCRRMVEGYKNVRVDNMTTSWRDGIAFCALVSKCASLKEMTDLVHFDELKKEDIYHNNELAFRVAEEYLNIPSLLDPQDMVDYEVPDKLSILTYLSQFYQVFGAQENSLRLKRSSTSEANNSSPTTPPAKMANVIPKREACVKCKNPVFFAERLVFNQKLHHRTCLRCARCNTILTLGNFYETENDDEYCCETCPDEEKLRPTEVFETNRLSIAQKIALFEKDSSNVLKKSLSDEEKSKSLSRQTPANSEAFNNFFGTQINKLPNLNNESEKTVELLSDSDNEELHAPPVPSTHPPDNIIPPIGDDIIEISEHKIISDNFVVVTKELTNDKDTEAIADTAEFFFESHDVKLDVAGKSTVVDDTGKKTLQVSLEEIELEFEKLVEDATNSPIESIKIVDKKVSTPTKTLILEVVKSDKVGVLEEKVQSTELQESIRDDSTIRTNDDEKTLNKDIEAIQEIKEIELNPILSETPETAEDSLEKAEIILNDHPSLAISEPEPEHQVEELKPEDHSYPVDLNPFGDNEIIPTISKSGSLNRPSLNPFGSCSEDEDGNLPERKSPISYSGTLPKPPRPPLPKSMTLKHSSTNPFGSDDEDTENSQPLRTPVPTPRKPLLNSATPEPLPRSLSNNNSPGHSFKGSTSSLSSSTDGMTLRRKKKKAPPPPVPLTTLNIDGTSTTKTPLATPKKKRPAPTPPISTLKPSSLAQTPPTLIFTTNDFSTSEDTQNTAESNESITILALDMSLDTSLIASQPNRRLIPLEECLIEEGSIVNETETGEAVTYRRKIVPLSSQTTQNESFENLEHSKDNKEAQNRQRQSQASLVSMRTGSESTDSLPYLNKSSHGKWKRRKGPAPSLPGYSQPQRRILQMLPLQEIRQELEVIEVQQQGLEKQGVMLEKMIRERCEGTADNRTTEELLQTLPSSKNPKEVEELILQLFELVNEKNELFRRQAELMYLRRAHRLEEEQADVEYEIRTLMAQPEQNKTDSDKAKEEALIARLVEIVQLRNEVVDCLDRDRLREAEEDLSIKQRMESHTAALDQDYLNQTPTKLSKKEKKKLKEAKKLKNKKLDADKDLDTSETTEKKKKKKKFLF